MKKLHSWIIVLSLAANVLLLGYVLGCGIMPRRPHMPMMDEVAGSKLPPAKKAMMESKMQEFHEKNKDRFDTIRAKREEISNILTAQNFDVDAFKAKSRELDSLFSDSKKMMVDEMANMAQTMSQEERKVLAGYMRRKRMPEPMGPPPEKGEIHENKTE